MANSYSTHIPFFVYFWKPHPHPPPPLNSVGSHYTSIEHNVTYTCYIHVHTHLPFPPEGKALQANKGTELTPSTADPCYNTINCTPSSSYCVTKITKLFQNFKKLAIKFYASTILCCICLLI